VNGVVMADVCNRTEVYWVDLGIPASHHLVPLVTEAMEEPTFFQQWLSLIDESFRPYAVAALDLGGVVRLDSAARQTFYRSIGTNKRREVLSSVSTRQVPERILKLLARTDWQRFSTQDWESFIQIGCANDETYLGHVRCISPELVRQFDLIPELLREPNFLELVAGLTISAVRWKDWAQFIDGEPANNRALIRHMAQSATTRGAVWDLFFWCQGRNRRPFDMPFGLLDSDLIEPIRSPQDMVLESKRMVNCLDKRVSRVWSRNRIYFKGCNRLKVDAELVRQANAWTPGDIFGPRNQHVALEIEAEIRNELTRLAEQLNQPSLSNTQADSERYLQDAQSIVVPTEVMDEVCNALQTIKGRSRSWTSGAYAIFESLSGGYVQAMSSPDGTEYLVEIASHKYVSSLNERLTDEVVDFIEKAGFVWPEGRSNFHRWLTISENDDLPEIAKLLMVAMTKIFGRFEWGELEVKTHVPA